MHRPNLLPLVAAAVLLLALAGCDVAGIDLSDGLAPAAEAVAVPPLGQEIVRLIVAERTQARASTPCTL